MGNHALKGHAPSSLLEFFKRDDLPGFIKLWRRIHSSRSGAVQVWFDIAVDVGAYDA